MQRTPVMFCALFVLAPLDLDYKARESVIASEEFFLPSKIFPGEVYNKTESLQPVNPACQSGLYREIKELPGNRSTKYWSEKTDLERKIFARRPKSQNLSRRHLNSELETMKASKSFVVKCKIVCHLVQFFVFHDIKSKCSGTDNTCSENVTEDQTRPLVPFTDSYDIATNRFKNMMDEHVSSWTISEEETKETEMSTRRQSQNPIWFEKWKSILTSSNFGKAAKTKV